MMQTQTPLISIGMIFKDDIRCIERCLKALQPLRDKFPCELIMADTGSEDGSREIAEKYADLVIDFPWVDDFSAARNAVMDLCSGKWYLSVDTDEYLREDSDFEKLREFLDNADRLSYNRAVVLIRNYTNHEFAGPYYDFMGVRMLRMSLGLRYEGTIHEHWPLDTRTSAVFGLPDIIFEHDGYVEHGANGDEAGRKKRARNVKLLREQMKKDPKSLIVRLQLIESGIDEPDFLEQIRHAVRMVKRKVPGWDQLGGAILRHAVDNAKMRRMPEFEEWAELAWEMFPKSLFTRLDVEYTQFSKSFEDKDYADCVERGERYLVAMEDYRAGEDPTARMYSTLKMAGPFQERGLILMLANACTYEGKMERALELLKGIDYPEMNNAHTSNLLKAAQELHFRSELDTAPLICAIWEGINEPKPSQKQADEREKIFIWIATQAFAHENRKQELEKEEFQRPGYTLYLPLKGKSEIGNAAEIMALEDTAELEAALRGVKKWAEFPAEALAHALEREVRFPLPDATLAFEEMDGLTARLAKQQDKDDMSFYSMVIRRSRTVPSDWQTLTWQRGLVMAAARAFDWEKEFKEDGEEAKHYKELGMSIVRAFAETERAFIPRYYTPETWAEENIYVLPPMHRFGWYCAQAFESLDRGDYSGCLHSLRAGMAVYEDIAKLVEFVLDQVEGMERAARIADAPPELVELAKQLKLMLTRFDPDDPAVVALKESEAYQKVAYLIEDTTVPAMVEELS